MPFPLRQRGDILIEQLKSEAVFSQFFELCAIGHGSFETEQMGDYLENFAKTHGLYVRRDDAGNVIIKKPASEGYEDKASVILQGHMDMVAVKTPDADNDPTKDGVIPCADDRFIWAKETSLGADDGFAVAMMLTILASDTIRHPALTAVFTNNEEVGMLGAAALDVSDIDGRSVINLDSGEEGLFCHSCAGGAIAECFLPAGTEAYQGCCFEVSIDGLTGGHSGTMIDKNRANAILLLGRYFFEMPDGLDARVISASGGEKDNAIAVKANAVFFTAAKDEDAVCAYTAKFAEIIAKEYEMSDPDAAVYISRREETKGDALTKESMIRFVRALTHLPSGVIRRMPNDASMVETSLNPGILTQSADGFTLTYCVRSALEAQKTYLLAKMDDLTRTLGGRMDVSGVYPAWEFQKESPLREHMERVFWKCYGKGPKMCSVHAGLECGFLSQKIRDFDCVSIGPDTYDIHTVNEKLGIASARRTFEYLVEVLATWGNS